MKILRQTYGRLKSGEIISKTTNINLPKLLLTVFLVTGVIRLTWEIGRKEEKDE